jgi:DNA gyrase subunit A
MEVIVGELRAIQTQFGDARRTRIIDATGDIGMEDLIAEEAMVVTLTTTGYIKRTPLSEYRTQRRGGRGRSGMNTKDEDNVANLFVASTHALLMIFTDQGQVYSLKVWEVPASGIAGGGKAIVNLIPLAEGEKVRSVLAVESLEDANRFLVFATKSGTVKRTALDQFKNLRAAGLRAINLGDDDDLMQVKVAQAHEAVLLVTARGQAIIFPLEDLRPLGRATQGVRGIKLRKDDSLVALEIVDARGLVADEAEAAEGAEEGEAAAIVEAAEPEADSDEGDGAATEEAGETLVFVTERGYGKRTPLKQFRVQRRGGLGLRALPYVARNGALVSAVLGRTEDDLMVVTAGGTIIRLSLAEVQVYSRSAKGVRIIKAEEAVVASYPVPAAEPEASADVEAALAARRAEAEAATGGGDADDILDALVRSAGGEDEDSEDSGDSAEDAGEEG